MEDRKVLLAHVVRLIELILAWDEFGEKYPEVNNTPLIDAAEQLVVESVDRAFKRYPVFPMPEVK